MSIVPLLALVADTAAEDPYLAPARAYIRRALPDNLLSVEKLELRAVNIAASEAFRAACATFAAAERVRVEQATVALRHAMRRAEELQRRNEELHRRIDGAIAVIDRASSNGIGPGHGAVALSNARLVLDGSRDGADAAELEACIARHPAGRALTTTDQP